MRRLLPFFAAFIAISTAGGGPGRTHEKTTQENPTQEKENFYAGKTITIVSYGGAGNNYDFYARLLARHLGKYIRGNPKIVVLNMPGDGGIAAANYMARVAPQDGTTFQIVSDGLLMFDAAGGPGLHASLGTFKWLGALSSTNMVTATWYTSNIRTIEDAKSREVRLGSAGAGAMSSMLPYVYNAFVGTKFVVVQGYGSAPDQHAAMERGELDGRGAGSWASFRHLLGQHIDDGKLHPLAQVGLKPETNLPNTPLLLDLAGNDPKKRAIATFVTRALTLSRSVNTGPGVPDDRIEILRKAIMAVAKDPEYLAELQKFRMDSGFVRGTEVDALVRDVLSTPKAVVRDAQTVMRLR